MNIQDEVYNKTLDMLESIFSTPFDLKQIDLKLNSCGFSANKEKIQATRLYECGKLVIMHVQFEEGSLYPFHCHEESAEHLVCISGKLQINIQPSKETQEFIKILTPSECMTLPIGVEHSAFALEKTEVVAICIPPELAYCRIK
jgi:mannose-6-phosphate isomerase-like protein (cupin superfamily)